MFCEKLKMGEVLGTGRDLLVADDMFEPDEGEVVDDLGGVDELVDVEVPIRPASTDGHGAVEAADNRRPVRERDQLTNTQGSFPCRFATDHIEIVRGFNDPPNDQRSTPKDSEVASGESERTQEVEEAVLAGGHETIVETRRYRVGAQEDMQPAAPRGCCSCTASIVGAFSA
jgi:hypothetical protein